ncbi:MAG: sulfite exporter TauE/SafE family protein, partial [Gammaproteobacteria bacterium]
MDFSLSTYALASVLIFFVSFLFAMLGLGGGMLYVPIFKWLGFPVKAVAIPVGLLLNGLNTLLAFIRYTREGLVDFKGGSPAAIAALALAPVGAFTVRYVSRDTLILLFALAVLAAGLRTLLTSGRPEPKGPVSFKKRLWIGSTVGGFAGFIGGLLGLGGGFIIGPMLIELG